MKHYRITLEGHTFDVVVLDDPRQRQVQVQVDGEVLTVKMETVTESLTSPPGPLSEAERGRLTSPPGPLSETEKGSARGQSLVPESAAVGDVVKAPLPGVVKSIAVRAGQQVASGDELLVIEAMKMDNIIRATWEGTVGDIYVAEGRQVAHGEPLLDLRRKL